MAGRDGGGTVVAGGLLLLAGVTIAGIGFFGPADDPALAWAPVLGVGVAALGAGLLALGLGRRNRAVRDRLLDDAELHAAVEGGFRQDADDAWALISRYADRPGIDREVVHRSVTEAAGDLQRLRRSLDTALLRSGGRG